MLDIGIKLLSSDAKVPEFKTAGAAAVDLVCPKDVILEGLYSTPVPTGVSIEIPDTHFGVIAVRSGLAGKGIMLTNGIGVIDSDYRGELIVLLYNIDDWDKEIQAGSRFAQLFFLQKAQFSFTLKDELSSTQRGNGGFGSTGLI